MQTVGPQSWLDDLAATRNEQAFEPLAADAEQRRQQTIANAQQPVAAPVEGHPTFLGSLPSFDDLMGHASQAAQAVQQAPQQAASWVSALPATFDDFMGRSAQQQPARPAATASTGTPAEMPTGQRLPSTAEPITSATMTQGPGQAPAGPAPAGPAPAAGGDLRAYARGVARQYGLDPDIFERQIDQESGFRPDAVSPAGAQGIAQFMPDTARGVGLADPFEPYSALDAAARHMRQNLDRNGGDYARALAAYNAGQGAVDQYGGVPPFAETQSYVRTILGGNRPASTAGAVPTSTAPAASPTWPPAGGGSVPPPAAAAPGGGDDMVTIRSNTGGTLRVPRSRVGEGPGQYSSRPEAGGYQIVDDGAPQASAQPDSLRMALQGGQATQDAYRQPLVPTQGDTLTGDEQPYDSRDADQGPHESGYALPPDPNDMRAVDEGPHELTPSGSDFGSSTESAKPEPPPGFPGLQAVYDAGGNFLHWIKGEPPRQQTYGPAEPSAPGRIHYPGEQPLEPTFGPEQVPEPPSRWSPEVQADLAGTPANPEPTTPRPAPPSGPLEQGISAAGRSQFLNEPQAAQAVDIYNAIQELPFEAYARARQQVVSDSEARNMAGTDPLAPFRGLGINLPSAEELNPTGRPASDVAAGLLLQGALPDPTDPIVQTGLMAAGKTLGLTMRGVRAGVRVAAPIAERGIEAAGRGARALGEEAAYQAIFGPYSTARHIVPPGEVQRIGGPVRGMDDPALRAAVENTPGAEMTPDGVAINLERWQSSLQAGEPSARTAVFYTPATGKRSPYRGVSPAGYGGDQQIAGPTILQSPYVIKGATGGTAVTRAYDALEGRGATDRLRSDIFSSVPSSFRRDVSDADRIGAIRDVLARNGGDPDMAEDIFYNHRRGNLMPTAILENVVASRLREAGHDSLIGYSTSRGKPVILEVIDLRESHYPTPEGGYTLRPEFQPPRAPTNASRVAAADARMAEQPGTQMLGSGVVPQGNPYDARNLTRSHIIPPDVSDTLDFPVRVPTDPGVVRAIEAAGGSVDPERGVNLNVIRYQGPEAHGGVATRGAPFYIAGPPGSRSLYATSGKSNVGGTERIEGPTRFRNPLFIMEREGRGYLDDALHQLDVRNPVSESRIAGYEQRLRDAERQLADVQARQPSDPGYGPQWLQSAEQYVEQARQELDAVRTRRDPVQGRQEIDNLINDLRRRTADHSPERAAGLKEIVSRYGGDPSVVDELMRLRPDDTESGYAIIENIIANNARRQGHDGVIYMGQRAPMPAEVDAHPAVKAAHDERFQINKRLGDIVREIDALAADMPPGLPEAELRKNPKIDALVDEYNRTYERLNDIPQKIEDARTEAYRELSTHHIDELFDPREGANPTPGAPNPTIAEAEQAFREANARHGKFYEQYMRESPTAEGYTEWATRTGNQAALQAEADARQAGLTLQEVDRLPRHVGTPGYTLRPDIPRRASETGAGVVPRLSPGLRAAGYNAAQGAALGATSEELQAEQEGRPVDRGEQARRAVTGGALAVFAGNRGARNAVRALGSGLVPRGANIEARLAEATARLSEVAGRLDVADQAARAAENGTVQEFRTASRAYSAIRREYDQAADAVARIRDEQRRIAGRMEQAGYGQPLEDAGLTTTAGHHEGTGPYENRGAMAPPRTVDDAPREGTISLGSGVVPGGQRVQQAVSAAQQRQARMAARGQAPLNPLEWTRRLAGEIGYASMIGPATATVNLTGNILEPLYSIPKEGVRAAKRGNLREWGEMSKGVFQGGVFHGLSEVGSAMVDALMARSKYAATPGHEPLSELTVNPIGHAVATALEAGGRVFSALPDAIFGTIAQGAGEARAAAQAATDAGLKGTAWKQHVNALLTDARAVKAGQLPSMAGTQDVIDAGTAYAKRQTFQDELGSIGKNVRDFATIAVVPDGAGGRKPLPVIGNLVTPFFNTPWNMNTRLLERTPAGFFMNSQGSKFDRYYDATLGSALIAGLAVGPAAAGYVTGSGPDDPEKRKELMATGWRPYSVLIGGVYIPTRTVGIYGPLLNAAGDAHDAIVYSKDKNPGSIASNYAGRLGKQVREQPYLQGLSNILEAFSAGQQGGLGAGAERYASSTITRMVPYAATARTIGTAMDPMERTTDRGKDVPALTTIGQQVRAGVGNRQGFEGQQPLPVQQDVLGRPQANPQQGIKSLFARTSSERADPVVQAFIDSGVDIPSPPQKAGDYIMTTAEKKTWNEARGQYVIAHMPPTIQQMTPARRAERLKDLLDLANESADRAVERTIPLNQRSQRRREAEAAQKAS